MDINLDTTVPSDRVYIYDESNNTMLQTGGIVTRLTWDRLERLDLEYFKTKVAPRLNTGEKDNLYVIRDSSAGFYTFILQDSVYRYHLTSTHQVELSDMVLYLRTKTGAMTIYDHPYPCIAEFTAGTRTTWTFRLDNYTMNYRCESPFKYEGTLYMPPMWAAMTFDVSEHPYNLTQLKLAVVLDDRQDIKERTLYKLPLANCSSIDGKCCLGNTQVMFGNIDRTKLSFAAQVNAHLLRYFAAEHNMDLMPMPHAVESILGDAFDKLPNAVKDKLPANTITRREYYKMLLVLSQRNGWTRLKFEPMSEKAEDFIR